MTWADAKLDSERMVEEIIRTRSLQETILLPEFDSEVTFRRYRTPNDPTSWNYHLQIVRSASRQLARRGFTVKKVTVRVADYDAWLQAQSETHSSTSLDQFLTTQRA